MALAPAIPSPLREESHVRLNDCVHSYLPGRVRLPPPSLRRGQESRLAQVQACRLSESLGVIDLAKAGDQPPYPPCGGTPPTRRDAREFRTLKFAEFPQHRSDI